MLHEFNALQDLIEHEFDGYSYFHLKDIDFEDEDKKNNIIWSVKIEFANTEVKELKFKSVKHKNTDVVELFVEVTEDSWYKVETYGSTIKHFWIALLID